MQKERVELFGETKMLCSGKKGYTVADVGRAGRGIVRLVALGMSIFSLMFILCCFFVGFEMSDGTPDTPSITVPPATESTPPLKNDGGDVGEGNKLPQTEGVTDAAKPDTTPEMTLKQLYYFDASAVPSGQTAIVPYDLSVSSLGESYIYNNTAYSPNISALLNKNVDFSTPITDSPLVLIVHTHGTEAYSPEGAVSYDGVSELARSSDITENVVSVGAVIAEELNENGICTLHCTVMHDMQSYKDSYSRSAETIKQYLEKYPTIKYVIDVHRDSVTNNDGDLLRPVTLSEGRAAAQVMCVVGSDESGADYPNWQDNLSFALKLRQALNEKCQGISRPVCLRPSAYNQQYAPISLLLEVGASGNYLSEAKVAARLCAEVLVDIIKK